ncbi:uncharacterized protein DS421_16g557200 [Arachis hypogaea]|nr:uncharacterized protein DS421_16g557200 [Arachis hypogaea]
MKVRAESRKKDWTVIMTGTVQLRWQRRLGSGTSEWRQEQRSSGRSLLGVSWRQRRDGHGSSSSGVPTAVEPPCDHFSLHAHSVSLPVTDLAARNGGTNGGDGGWA